MPRGVDAVDRALTILEAFSDGPRALSLHEIWQRTNFHKSTILRLCGSLENFGYLVRGEDNLFRLGSTCGRFGALFQASFNLADIIRPAISGLVAKSNETVSFYVRSGDQRTCLFRMNANRSTRHHIEEGEQLPLDRGASGLILLAADGAIGARFDEIREAGFVVTYGERDPDTASISSPVRDANGATIGALSVSGLRSRFDDDTVARLLAHLLASVRTIEAKLGRPSRSQIVDAKSD